MTSITFSRVSGRTLFLLFKTRETVAEDTPAAFATCWILIFYMYKIPPWESFKTLFHKLKQKYIDKNMETWYSDINELAILLNVTHFI